MLQEAVFKAPWCASRYTTELHFENSLWISLHFIPPDYCRKNQSQVISCVVSWELLLNVRNLQRPLDSSDTEQTPSYQCTWLPQLQLPLERMASSKAHSLLFNVIQNPDRYSHSWQIKATRFWAPLLENHNLCTSTWYSTEPWTIQRLINLSSLITPQEGFCHCLYPTYTTMQDYLILCLEVHSVSQLTWNIYLTWLFIHFSSSAITW